MKFRILIILVLFLSFQLLLSIGCSPLSDSSRNNYPRTINPDNPYKVQSEESVQTNTPGDEPIFLVHGFMDTTSTPWWSYLYDHLKSVGYKEKNIHTVSFETIPFLNVHSPQSNAKYLEKQIEEVSTESGKKVDIIAHSLGGIVARIYLEGMGGAENVDDLITLGTPHQGTYYSYMWYITPGARNTVPSSQLLEALNDGQLAKGVEYTSVWGSLDWAYLRDEGAKIPKPELTSIKNARNIWGGYQTHMSLLHSREVFDLYVKYLD